jgi:hypothetical protein
MQINAGSARGTHDLAVINLVTGLEGIRHVATIATIHS